MIEHQPALFDPPAQPRNAKPESKTVYDAVIRLRGRGARNVYRAGRDVHVVDGVRITTEQLIALADTSAPVTGGGT